MHKKEARKNRLFLIKVSFLLLLSLILVEFLPHATITGGIVYAPRSSGVIIGETDVTSEGALVVPMVISESALRRVQAAENTNALDALVVDITAPFAPDRITTLFGKQSARTAFTTLVPSSVETPSVEAHLIQLFAASHAGFAEQFPHCLSKLANTFLGDTPTVITSTPRIHEGDIPGYNSGWLYVSTVLSLQVSTTTICEMPSSCAGTVNLKTGEIGTCW
ncbi:MAG: hypothetical protein Q7R76_00815 [Candidatus Woesearchaeota archaeon]|nr:hypothetical protein [Candidatus Woesearchaeota archaeon]